MTTRTYMEVIRAANETVQKMLLQRTGSMFSVTVTTQGGVTAAARRCGYAFTVDMPSFPPDTVLSRSEADRMVAYLAHEVCHALHTDFSEWDAAVKDGSRVRSWTNALEDLRIEAHEIKTGPYKALPELLASLVAQLYADARNSLAARGTTLGQSFVNGPFITTILGRAANGYPLPTVATLHRELSPELRQLVDHALANIGACKSTADCHALARVLVTMEGALKEADKPNTQKPTQKPKDPPQKPDDEEGDTETPDTDKPACDDGDGPSDEEGKGEGDEGDERGEGEGDGADEGDDADDENTKGGEGEGDEGDDEGEGDGASEGDDDASEDIGTGNGHGGRKHDLPDTEIEADLNLGETAKNIADRTPQERNDYSYRLNTMSARRRRYHPNAGDEPGQRQMLEYDLPRCSVLFGQIERLLVSEARTARTHHETSGRLDRRALVRMRTGAQDVFSRRDFAPAVDTAVTVLIDCSGSMAGTRMYLAQKTAWLLARAAEAANGKLAIVGFSGSAEETLLTTVKHWDAPATASTLARLKAGHYTPLSASIVAAAQDLSEVIATRHILLVLTDGDCDLRQAATQSACRLAAHLGVETAGIGMNAPGVVDAFPARYSVNVDDLDQLATTGLGTLASMLEDAGTR